MHTKHFSVVPKLTALLFALAIPVAALAAGSGHPAGASVTAAVSPTSGANADDDLGWG